MNYFSFGVPRKVIGKMVKNPVPYEDGSAIAFEKMKDYEWGPFIEDDANDNGEDQDVEDQTSKPNLSSNSLGVKVISRSDREKNWWRMQKEILKRKYVQAVMKNGEDAANDSNDSEQSVSSSFSVKSFTPVRSRATTGSKYSTRTDFARNRNADEIAKNLFLTQEEKEQAIVEYKKSLPPFHLDNLKFPCAKNERPNYDVENIANLIVYNEIIAKIEQPEWRKELIKKYGPTGVHYFDYGPLSTAVTWKWDVDRFGDWSVDNRRELTFNGHKFMLRHMDGTRRSVTLESWLRGMAVKRDAKALDDNKWVFKKLYFELILQMEVSYEILYKL